MKNLFGIRSTESDNGEHWLSISDLMSGLMIVFLFISIVFMLQQKKENKKIKQIAVAYKENQVALYNSLTSEFKNDLKKWGAFVDKDTLSFNFQAPEVLFSNGSTELTPHFKKILRDFFPRYLKILKPYRKTLDEVRIEGHTSSIWRRTTTETEAYFKNMQLSQGRTREVLQFVYSLNAHDSKWIKAHIAAVGFSSSRLIKKGGKEIAKQSRRVSFRAITNADIQIKKILEVDE